MKKIVVLSNTAFSIEKFRLHYLKRLSGYAIDIYTPNPKIKINSNLKNIRSYKFFTKNLIQELFTINKIINKNNNATFLVFSFKYQFLYPILAFIYIYSTLSLCFYQVNSLSNCCSLKNLSLIKFC